MSTAALLFAATFAVVFTLGLQQLNVDGGHRWLAAGTSVLIGASNLVLFKLLPGPTDALQIAGYLLGGPVGIVAAMALHPSLVGSFKRSRIADLITYPPTPPMPPRRGHVPPRPVPPPAWQRWEQRPAVIDPLRQLAQDLLDPDSLGRLAAPEIRERAARALNP